MQVAATWSHWLKSRQGPKDGWPESVEKQFLFVFKKNKKNQEEQEEQKELENQEEQKEQEEPKT